VRPGKGPELTALKPAVDLRREFEERFGTTPRLFRAPGRVNLIGEHTDYNEGWVMPAAIEFNTWVAIAPRDDNELSVVSLNFGEQRTFSLRDAVLPSKSWIDYVAGVTLVLRSAGHPVSGANMLIWGDVPLGAGLSSSASLEVACATALLGIIGTHIDGNDLARLCQRAENEFVGARCGIMDQFISANSKAGNALMLDCRTLEFELVTVPKELSIVVCNTMVKHQLSGGEYNTRRAECEEGVRILKHWYPAARSLRDISSEQLELYRTDLPEVIFRRCRHVVTEDERVLAFARALREDDLSEAGELMAASHKSLRDDYEVSCPELDVMVELAARTAGTIGSRMTGGGFGGCTVNLVRNDAVENFRAVVARDYAEVIGVEPEIYVTRAAEGASEVLGATVEDE
jgi:galactokinase